MDRNIRTLNLTKFYIFFEFIYFVSFTLQAGEPSFGPTWPQRVHLNKSPLAIKPIDWNKETIYFILIDRFYNGDPSNDGGNNPLSHVLYQPVLGNTEALKTYQGGDLQGIIDKLDYLHNLGITTIWLSPVFDNSDNAFVDWWPYHGYHPIDFFKIDEHFGDVSLLKKLVSKAHQRGMKVLLDMICNHVAPDHAWVRDPRLWEIQDYKQWFHPHSGKDASTSIQDWQNQEQLETRELNGLPDLAQENPHVYDFLLDVAKYWIIETGCDGFRLDAVKHIPRQFWSQFCHDVHTFAGDDFLLLGEVFSGETPYVASYENVGFNALFDIPMYYTINRVFAQGGRMQLLSEQIARNRASYHRVILSPVIDNHDVARFSYWAGLHAKDKMKQAITFAFTQPGMPMLYYGSEVALEGASATHEQTGAGQDYLNRFMLPWQRIIGADADLVQHIRHILNLRQKWPALGDSSLIECYKDYSIYAYLKYDEKHAVLIVLSNSSETELRRIQLPSGVFGERTTWANLLSKQKYCACRDTLTLELAPYSSYLLVANGKWQSNNLRHANWQCALTPVISRDMQWVEFSFQGPSQLSVTVAGDFNGWSAQNDSLHKNADGQWQTKLPLKRGRYRYKFVIDGKTWRPDERAKESELDPYGSRNSIVGVE